MNMVDKVVNDKYYRKVNTEKLIYASLYNGFFGYFSFFLLIVGRVSTYEIRFFSELMPVNVCQHRGFVGVFNSRFIHIKQPNIFKNAFSQINVKQTIAKETFSVFASFSIFLLISISWSFVNLISNQSQIYQFFSRQDFLFLCSINFRIPYLVISDHIYHIEAGTLKKILDQSLILVKVFLFGTGI